MCNHPEVDKCLRATNGPHSDCNDILTDTDARGPRIQIMQVCGVYPWPEKEKLSNKALLLKCGHVVLVNPAFYYCAGEYHRCSVCRQIEVAKRNG